MSIDEMRILAVDDDSVILELLYATLTSFGYKEVVLAGSGPEALKILEASATGFDALLFDIQMPEMDGIELVIATRNMDRYRDTPILMLTAMSEKSFIDRAFVAGATDYVTKPFETAELKARLNVAQLLSDNQRSLTEKVFAAKAIRGTHATPIPTHQIPLEDAFPVRDVDCVIPLTAFENYMKQLSRRSLFGTSLIAFQIDGVDRLYNSMTDYEYSCLVTDTADILTHAVSLFPQHLLTHYGNGTFLCVSERTQGWHLEQLPMNIEQAIGEIDPCYGDGRPMMLSIRTGEPIQMRFRSGASVQESISAAIMKIGAGQNSLNGEDTFSRLSLLG